MPDDVVGMSIMAKKHNIFHVVNNAYGIWCSKIAHSIGEGLKLGECTVVVQSTDKNLMVPVGGSFLFTNSPELLTKSNLALKKFQQNIREGQAAAPSLTYSLRY